MTNRAGSCPSSGAVPVPHEAGPVPRARDRGRCLRIGTTRGSGSRSAAQPIMACSLAARSDRVTATARRRPRRRPTNFCPPPVRRRAEEARHCRAGAPTARTACSCRSAAWRTRSSPTPDPTTPRPPCTPHTSHSRRRPGGAGEQGHRRTVPVVRGMVTTAAPMAKPAAIRERQDCPGPPLAMDSRSPVPTGVCRRRFNRKPGSYGRRFRRPGDRDPPARRDAPATPRRKAALTRKNALTGASRTPSSTPVRFRDLPSRFVEGPPLIVTATSCCLVASAPAGPVQQSGRGHGRWVEDSGEQVADLRDGQRDRIAAAGGVVRVGGPVRGRAGGDGSQESQGEHGERDVPVPCGPVADLVIVEADLALGGLGRVGRAARCQVSWSFSARPPSEPDGPAFRASGSPVTTA